eukprot:Skav219115  [mRNA]  locus=scaffold1574:370711:370956:- [translate_table: standard]
MWRLQSNPHTALKAVGQGLLLSIIRHIQRSLHHSGAVFAVRQCPNILDHLLNRLPTWRALLHELLADPVAVAVAPTARRSH